MPKTIAPKTTAKPNANIVQTSSIGINRPCAPDCDDVVAVDVEAVDEVTAGAEIDGVEYGISVVYTADAAVADDEEAGKQSYWALQNS